MGVFDIIVFESAYEPCDIAAGQEFQTKSLDAIGSKFTINNQGRLIEIDSGEVEDFHGDIKIHGTMLDNLFKQFIIRFTYGKLEWVRELKTV